MQLRHSGIAELSVAPSVHRTQIRANTNSNRKADPMANLLEDLKKRREYARTVRALTTLPIDVALDLDIYAGDARVIAHRAVYGK